MTLEVTAVRVLIASPSDVVDAREAVRQAMNTWNSANAERRRLVMLPLMWEYDSVPTYGTDPQTSLNQQLVEKCDALIGTFWTRLGSPTGRAESGTVEEIKETHDRGKPVYLYFRTTPVVLDTLDLTEYERFRDFKSEIRSTALYGEYAELAELQVLIGRALDSIADRLGTGVSDSVAPAAGAVPVAMYESEREVSGFSKTGSPRYRTRSAIMIENRGEVSAEQFRARLDDGPDIPHMVGNEKAVEHFAPGGTLRFPLALAMGMSDVVTVIMEWEENGSPRTERQSLTLY